MESDPSTSEAAWEVSSGPIPCVPLREPDTSACWAWKMRHKTKDLEGVVFVRVTWKGFDSIEDIPASLTKDVYASRGRLGIDSIVDKRWLPDELLYHSQSHHRPAWGSWGANHRPQLIPLDPDPHA